MYFQKDRPNPIMAVLVNPNTIKNLQRQVVIHRIKLLVEANKEVNNILYYFSLKHVNLKKRKITGYYWDNRYKKWLSEEFAYPDILYIRGEIHKKYTHIFDELFYYVKSNGKVINHSRFNKWQLYQMMNKDPVMKGYLPVTQDVKQPADIKKMLRKHKIIYLKPHFGRKGQNVLRVEALSDGCYQYSYQNCKQLSIEKTFNFKTLQDFIDKFFCGKSYLVQQSINLIKIKDRPIDLRAELQRNGNGELEIVGISVRLGHPGSPITTHADAFKFDNFFINKLHYSKKKFERLQSNVEVFLTSVYKLLIEKNYGEQVEIGIDFAIDANEKIWFIEANSQSAKVSLEKAFDSAVVSRAYKNILEYARYLRNKYFKPQTHN